MESEASGDVLTKRNHNLLNIAKLANIAAWVVLVVYLISSGYQFIYTNQLLGFIPQHIDGNYKTWGVEEVNGIPTEVVYQTYFEKVLADPFGGTRVISRLILDIAKGLVAFLVILGISLGLRMLVETDINYRFLRLNDITDNQEGVQATPDDRINRSSKNSRTKIIIEIGTLIKDTDPVFYDPEKVTLLVKWIYRILNILIVLTILNNFSNLGSIIISLNQNWAVLGNIILGIGFSIIISILMYFVQLKTLAYLLKILREMEFNSRRPA